MKFPSGGRLATPTPKTAAAIFIDCPNLFFFLLFSDVELKWLRKSAGQIILSIKRKLWSSFMVKQEVECHYIKLLFDNIMREK